MGKVIYGSELASNIKENLKEEINILKEKQQRLPKLVVILVGNDVGSKSYVKGKEKDCLEVGIINETIYYDDISEKELLQKINELNNDDSVDGILVQLPLPQHIDTNKVLFSIDPSKDVDGFHPFNIGKMMLNEETYLPCTPKGVINILDSIGLNDLSGKKALVIGRSNIVGKPMAQLLINHHATVTIAHSKTEDLISEIKQADILIVAMGKPKFIQKEWLKPNVIIIDVGVNRDENNKLCGDVDFDACKDIASYITPVPKGVGPMTRAMLLTNTLEAYKKHEGE